MTNQLVHLLHQKSILGEFEKKNLMLQKKENYNEIQDMTLTKKAN